MTMKSRGYSIVTTPACKICNLMVHNPSNCPDEIILSPEIFFDYERNELIQVYDPDNPTNRIILRVPSNQAAAGRLEISILKAIADSSGLKPFNKVIVDKVAESNCELDFVELSFKKQYLQRGNMFRFKTAMSNRTTYIGQNITINSLQAQIQELRKESSQKTSGLITENTKFVFRSKSTRIIWLVQISAEMWDIDKVT